MLVVIPLKYIYTVFRTIENSVSGDNAYNDIDKKIKPWINIGTRRIYYFMSLCLHLYMNGLWTEMLIRETSLWYKAVHVTLFCRPVFLLNNLPI